MEWLLLALWLALLLLAAGAIGRRVAQNGRHRFFAAVGAGTLCAGGTISALSVARLVTPAHALVAQALVTTVVLLLQRFTKAGLCESGTRRSRVFVSAVEMRTSLRDLPDSQSPALKVGPGRRSRWSVLDRVLVLALVAMTLLTGFEQLFLPVSNIDDRNYRASRAAYWLQHRSVFGYDSHNDRQVAFPIGGSLPFFAGILFTRDERAGLLLQWSAYPLVAVAAFHLLRSLRLTRTASLLGTATLCFIPIVLLHTRGAQPDMWLTLFALGCAYWNARARRRRRAVSSTAKAATFALLAINVRMTALPLLAITLAQPAMGRHGGLKRTVAGVGGAVVALLLCGLLPVLIYNLRHFGHPLGSQPFREIHSAAWWNPEHLRVHSARAQVVLLEPPFLPQSLRARYESMQKRLLHVLGGDAMLPREDQPWPGHFVPQARRWAENYSLGGLILFPIMLLFVWRAIRRRRRQWTSPDIIASLGCFLIATAMMLVRWMGGIARFWVAGYALVIVAAAAYVSRAGARHRRAARAAGAFVGLMIVPAAYHRATLVADVARPEPAVALDEPYAEPLAHIPPGSTILLVAGQGTRDYPLFAPRDGYTNRVVSWGRHDFDRSRLNDLVTREGVTHVIIENDAALDFGWDPPVATPPFVAGLAADGGFVEVPLPYTPHMRLFARKPTELDRPAAAR